MSLNIPASVYRDSTPPELTEEQEQLKKEFLFSIMFCF